MPVIVAMAVLVAVVNVSVATVSMDLTKQTMLKDIIGGIANLWTRDNDKSKPRNVKDYITSELELQNPDFEVNKPV